MVGEAPRQAEGAPRIGAEGEDRGGGRRKDAPMPHRAWHTGKGRSPDKGAMWPDVHFRRMLLLWWGIITNNRLNSMEVTNNRNDNVSF